MQSSIAATSGHASGCDSLRCEWWIISGLLVVLAIFHFVTIQRQSFFVDEMSEIAIAQLDWDEIPLKADSMPPLYSYCLKAWISLLGIESARWLSAFLGMATVAAIWWIVRTLVDRNVGLVVAAVLAISPFQLYYAQLVRSYVLFTLLAVLSIGLFAALARTGARREKLRVAVAFVLVSVAGLFTHYYFALLLGTLALFWVVARRGRIGGSFALVATGIGLLASPVVVCLMSDFAYQQQLRDSRPLHAATLGYTFVSFFSGYSLGPSKSDLQTLSTAGAVRQILPWAVVIALCGGLLVLAGIRRLARHRLAWATVSLAVLPVLLTGLLGWSTGITYNVRFVVWCVAPLAVLLAAGVVEAWPSWRGRVATAGLLLLFVVAITNRYCVARYQTEDLAAAACYLESNTSPNEPVFVVSDYLHRPLDYYLADAHAIYRLPQPGEENGTVTDDADAQSATDSIARNATRSYWLVYSREFHGDPDGFLLEQLRAQHGLEEVAEFPGVRVFRGNAVPDRRR